MSSSPALEAKSTGHKATSLNTSALSVAHVNKHSMSSDRDNKVFLLLGMRNVGLGPTLPTRPRPYATYLFLAKQRPSEKPIHIKNGSRLHAATQCRSSF